MNWKLFLILFAIGFVLYVLWLFYSQRETAYLSILLYQRGDADGYLKELESPSARFFFSKKLRTLMAIDANLMKNNDAETERLFQEADAMKLGAGDRFTVLQKELTYYAGGKANEKADKAYAQMKEIYDKDLSRKQKETHKEALQEAEYIHAIYVASDGKYASDLMQRARSLKDDIPAGISYIMAAQSYWLRGDKKQCQLGVEKAEPKLRNTSWGSMVTDIVRKKDYERVMDVRIMK